MLLQGGTDVRTKLPQWSLVAGVLVVLLAGVATAAPGALADGALRLPLRVDARLSLGQQFGYAPDYELNVPSFDPWGGACIRSRTATQHATGHVHRLGADGWRRFPLVAAVRRDCPGFVGTVNAGGYVAESVEFDALGRAYTLLEIRLRDGTLRNVLMYSLDGCATWRTLVLPFARRATRPGERDDGTATIEHFSGWNLSEEPPLVAVWKKTGAWPGLRATRNRLYVLRPYFDGDELLLAKPQLVTTRHLGMVQAAGGASFAATTGTTSFIVWTEVAAATAGGSPTFVAALDRTSGSLTRPVWVARARPANDVHCTPGICLDGQGYLHVVTGAHQRPFQYARSLRPLDPSSWSRPRPVLSSGYRAAGSGGAEAGRQTYLSLACLPDCTLVTVFRQQRAGVDAVFAGHAYDVLCVQTKAVDGDWGPARRLVMSKDRRGYAIFYQKLAVDRTGRLFLSLNWCNPRDYAPAERWRRRYCGRMVLSSSDAARSWSFATDEDFSAGVVEGAAREPAVTP
jgi:BNR repeat-containing family member